MTNEHNFKVGDKVRHLGYNLCGIITDILGEGFVKAKAIDYEVFSIWDINNLELCDRKTAFLRELQALLRKYDAKIAYDTRCDKFEIYFCDGYKIVDRIFCPLKYPEFIEDGIDDIGYLNLTADNIMDFDKD